MEEMQDIDQALPAEPSPALPKALRAPTRLVGYGFMILLTASAMSLYILYAGIGALLLPQEELGPARGMALYLGQPADIRPPEHLIDTQPSS